MLHYRFFISLKQKIMIKRDLLFFCPKCKNLSDDLVSNLKCDIPGKHKTYKKGELISAQGDKITHMVMLTRGKVKTELISD